MELFIGLAILLGGLWLLISVIASIMLEDLVDGTIAASFVTFVVGTLGTIIYWGCYWLVRASHA